MKPHKLMKYMVAEKQALIPLSACFFHFFSFEFLFSILRERIHTTFREVFDPKLFYLCLSFSWQMNIHQYAIFYYMMISIIFLFMSKLIYGVNEMFNF